MITPASPAAAISALIDGMYDAFLAGDQTLFDAALADDVTTWETHLPGPLRTRAELDAYRAQRDAAGSRPSLVELRASEQRIDVWGELAVARYVLVARESPDAAPEHSRVTDVLRLQDGRWQIVHHHSELVCP